MKRLIAYAIALAIITAGVVIGCQVVTQRMQHVQSIHPCVNCRVWEE